MRQVFILPVNPEPWRVPPMSPGRIGRKLIVRAGKDAQSDSYKKAIAEELIARGAQMLEPPYKVDFLFSRKLSTYETDSGKDHTKHHADMTNCQKLTEDAMQGVLITNDKNDRSVSAFELEQGRDAFGYVVIMIESEYAPPAPPLPDWVDSDELFRNVEVMKKAEDRPPVDNSWGGSGSGADF